MSSIVWGWFQTKQIYERIQVILTGGERLQYTADYIVLTGMDESKLHCLLLIIPKKQSNVTSLKGVTHVLRVQCGTTPLVRLSQSLEYRHQSQAFAILLRILWIKLFSNTSHRSSIGSNKRGKQARNNGKQGRTSRGINEQKVVDLVTVFWGNHEIQNEGHRIRSHSSIVFERAGKGGFPS